MVAIYARQSVDRPDSISIETQVERCRDSLTARELEHCKTFVDRGFSGKNIDRPAFQTLLGEIRDGAVDKIVVYKLDRVSRSVHDFTGLCDLLTAKHVAFRSCEDGVTLDETPAGTAMAQIMMVFAQFERETIQRRVTDNYYERARAGMYLGGKPPYGFGKGETVIAGKKTACFVPDPARGAVVTALYERYVAPGASLGALMRWLNEEKRLPASRGGWWSTVQIGRLLRNPAYVRADAAVYQYLRRRGAQPTDHVEQYQGCNGCYLYAARAGRTQSKFSNPAGALLSLAPHEGLVGADLWLAAQRKLDAQKMLKNSGRGSHSWLSGLMKCEVCGYAVTVVNKPDPAHGHYINCGGRKRAICPGRSRVTTLEEIEAAAERVLLSFLRDLTDVPAGQARAAAPRVNQLEIQAAAIEQERDRLLRNLGMVEEPDVVRLLASQLHALNHQLQQVRDEQEALQYRDSAEEAQARFSAVLEQWPGYPVARKKAVAWAVLERVVVGDGRVEVVLKA